jgi:hypothetical protein
MRYFEAPCTEVNPVVKKTASGAFQAIFEVSAVWEPGQVGTITVTFGGATCDGCSPDAAWSQVGSKSSSKNPSMNLGFIDPPFDKFTFNEKEYPFEQFSDATRNYCEAGKDTCKPAWVPGATVIHEFCHALGMLHEHQNNLLNSNNIKLNKDAVIRYYENIGMTSDDAVANVLNRYSCESDKCKYVGSVFDPKSIMLYALPDNWVDGPNPTKPNFVLSDLDKQWLGKEYPSEPSRAYPQLTVKFIDPHAPKKFWKQAWVCKTIIEQLLPLVYVGMRFVLSDDTDITYTPPTMYKQPSKSIESIGQMTPTSPPVPAQVPAQGLTPTQPSVPQGQPITNVESVIQNIKEPFKNFERKYTKTYFVVMLIIIFIIYLMTK